jgi:hypothetical protein
MNFSRKITCKACGVSGVVQAHDTNYCPPEQIFLHLGKDRNGYLHFECPNCKTDAPYSPSEFISPTFKFFCFIAVALIVWIIVKLF